MGLPTRVFIDFWNFQLQWQDRAAGARCDWTKLPIVLSTAAVAYAPQLGALEVEDTRVYASWNPMREGNLRHWLDTFLDRQPGFRVFVRERKDHPAPVRCQACRHEQATCPSCGVPYHRAVEKGTDAAILTDMFALGWEGAYKVAILVSGDADLVPAVLEIQDRGLKIVNATWQQYGHELAKACWASFSIDPLIPQLSRQQ